MVIQRCIRGRTTAAVVESIERSIAGGELKPGEKLPPIRTLADHLGLSPATVSGAYRQLQRRGFLVSEGRRGTVVRTPPQLVVNSMQAPEGVVDCATGNPDLQLLPKLGPALASVRREQGLYNEAPNHPVLVQLGTALFQKDGIDTETTCIVNGSLDGMERALAEHVFPGDRVAVEDPCYNGVLDLVRARGLIPVPVALDDSGIQPVALKSALRAKPKALIVTPRAQNPTGAAFTAKRAKELRQVLREAPDLFIIEDDYQGLVSDQSYHGLQERGRSRWSVIRSLGKALGPDLRIALQAGDKQTLSRIHGRQVLGVRWVSHLLQDLAVYFLEDPKTAQLLERARQTYSQRRTRFIELLRGEGIEAMGGSGFHVWIPVPDEAYAAQRLLQAGWLIAPGQRYRLQCGPAIRVTVASLKESQARALTSEIKACLQGGSFGHPAV